MNTLKNIVVSEITDVVTVYSPKGRIIKMNNRNTYGMSFCSEGQIIYTHNEKKYVSDNRHIIILPKGQNYSLEGTKTGNFPVINFTCSYDFTDSFIVLPVHSTASFMHDYKKIQELILFPENRTKIMSIFYDMIYKLSSEHSICRIIMPAIKYIENNYKDYTLSNQTLADVCNISEIYLRKLFIKHLNTTPKQYICDIRLSKAKQLLSEGILKTNAICEQCGFSSLSNFSRFFKERTGLTPTEYLKENMHYKI